VLVAVISRVSRAHAFTHVFLDPGMPDGQAAGVLHPSYVQCEDSLVLDKGLVLRTIGKSSPALTARRNQCLKRASVHPDGKPAGDGPTQRPHAAEPTANMADVPRVSRLER
jgi:hypothetical protein